jgi:hypothetical protein
LSSATDNGTDGDDSGGGGKIAAQGICGGSSGAGITAWRELKEGIGKFWSKYKTASVLAPVVTFS